MQLSMQETVIILDSIRSAHNVGSIFRTSDAAGVSKIYLCGPTPDPIDRFGREQKEIAKTSLGATQSIPWEHIGVIESRSAQAVLALCTKLQQEGFTVVAVEQSAQSVDLYDFVVPQKVAYIFGAEVEGVLPELISAADVVLELPMRGMKESLNVSVTAGIVLFQNKN